VSGPDPIGKAKRVQAGPDRAVPSFRAEEERLSTPATGGLPAHPRTGGPEEQADLLGNAAIAAAQRQGWATQIGRVQGNRYLQRVIAQITQGDRAVQRQTDAGVAEGPRDASLPAGVPAAELETPGAPPAVQIPTELLSSVDPSAMGEEELRYRYDLIQQTLMLLSQSSPDTQLLQEQATQISAALAERQVEAAVQADLEAFLAGFSGITVTVTWAEDTGTESVQRTEEITVHPPYFMNVPDRSEAQGRTLQRYDAAQANRRAADRATRRLLHEAFARRGTGAMDLGRARVGKSHPEDIRQILQSALDRNLVQPGAGRDHPDGTDLRNWLIRYGIGVDCSGFVSQALNRVTETIRGESLPAGQQLNAGGRALTGGARGFTRIQDAAQLRPGDTMSIPGHIRIVTGVRR
jgi:hypothetical protein